jgi:heat shock protein HslJ
MVMHMNMLRTAFALLAITVALTACAPQSAPIALEKTAWRLTALTHNGASVTLVSGREPTLTFTDATTAGGNGGCNSYGGTYTISGESISFDGIASTMMACDGVMDQETQFTSALPQKPNSLSIKRAGTTLTLRNADGSTMLSFVAVP